jgi:hypothetical protein
LGQVLHLGLQLFLPPGTRSLGVLPPGQGLVGPFQELLLPLGDGGLGHLESSGRLNLGHLTTQDRQNNLQLLVGGLERLSAHDHTSHRVPSDHSRMCPRNSDSVQWDYTYDA